MSSDYDRLIRDVLAGASEKDPAPSDDEALKRALLDQSDEKAFGQDPRTDDELWSDALGDENFRAHIRGGAMTERKDTPVKETLWSDGHYVLTVDRFETIGQECFRRGDTLHLDEGEATRLGLGKAIAPVGTLEACRAQVSVIEDDEERRNQMLLLDADELEEKARRLRELADAGVSSPPSTALNPRSNPAEGGVKVVQELGIDDLLRHLRDGELEEDVNRLRRFFFKPWAALYELHLSPKADPTKLERWRAAAYERAISTLLLWEGMRSSI